MKILKIFGLLIASSIMCWNFISSPPQELLSYTLYMICVIGASISIPLYIYISFCEIIRLRKELEELKEQK